MTPPKSVRTSPHARRQEHWGFPDPSVVTGSEEERLAAFRSVRDAIARRIESLVNAISDYFPLHVWDEKGHFRWSLQRIFRLLQAVQKSLQKSTKGEMTEYYADRLSSTVQRSPLAQTLQE
jgi:hypothetical protein